MNKESANTMLKFLEEPDGNVIGFFLTNNKNNVMLTIQSRCEIIEVNFANDTYEKYNIDAETYQSYLDTIKDYLVKIEVEKKSLILYNKECLINYEKDELKSIFQIILDIYQNILNSKFNSVAPNEEFNFLQDLSVNNIKKKINLLIEFLKEITYNVNLDLLLDRFIIEMEEVNNALV